MKLITRHIATPDVKIHDVIELTGSHSVCAMTGDIIQFGILKKDVIGDNFTDHAYLRYPSAYVSIDVAKAIVGKLENGNGLRNYSFYATETRLQLLKREEILPLILAEKETPFVLGVTFSNKKHIGFKTTPQYDSDNFRIYTDLGECVFNRADIMPFLTIMNMWYTVIPDKRNTEAQPTYFTKANILGETIPSHMQIAAYGEDEYFLENEFLNQMRGTLIFKVLCHALNKIL